LGDVLLVTGRPGVGKTAVVRRLAEAFAGHVGGFYTEEIRQEGRRVGFLLVTLDGDAAPFARSDWERAAHRVGRYGVDLHVLERLGVTAIREALEAHRAVREAVEAAASGPTCLVATILAAVARCPRPRSGP
jgi:nucleoside-triphosphatase